MGWRVRLRPPVRVRGSTANGCRQIAGRGKLLSHNPSSNRFQLRSCTVFLSVTGIVTVSMWCIASARMYVHSGQLLAKTLFTSTTLPSGASGLSTPCPIKMSLSASGSMPIARATFCPDGRPSRQPRRRFRLGKESGGSFGSTTDGGRCDSGFTTEVSIRYANWRRFFLIAAGPS